MLVKLEMLYMTCADLLAVSSFPSGCCDMMCEIS